MFRLAKRFFHSGLFYAFRGLGLYPDSFQNVSKVKILQKNSIFAKRDLGNMLSRTVVKYSCTHQSKGRDKNNSPFVMQSMSNLTWPVFLIASGSQNSVGLKIKETVQ